MLYTFETGCLTGSSFAKKWCGQKVDNLKKNFSCCVFDFLKLINKHKNSARRRPTYHAIACWKMCHEILRHPLSVPEGYWIPLGVVEMP
jgi:hypothetical protein